MVMLLHSNNSTVYGHATAQQQLSCIRSCCCTSATPMHMLMLLQFNNSTTYRYDVALQQL